MTRILLFLIAATMIGVGGELEDVKGQRDAAVRTADAAAATELVKTRDALLAAGKVAEAGRVDAAAGFLLEKDLAGTQWEFCREQGKLGDVVLKADGTLTSKEYPEALWEVTPEGNFLWSYSKGSSFAMKWDPAGRCYAGKPPGGTWRSLKPVKPRGALVAMPTDLPRETRGTIDKWNAAGARIRKIYMEQLEQLKKKMVAAKSLDEAVKVDAELTKAKLEVAGAPEGKTLMSGPKSQK